MKLSVPFYKQKTESDCAPIALKMVLSYFGEDFDTKILEKRIGRKKGKGVITTQIAKASASLGYRTKFYSINVSFPYIDMSQPFYQKYFDKLSDIEKITEEAKREGVVIKEKSLSLERLLKNVGEDSISIVLLDWNVVINRKEKGYLGHFVPIVGYNNKLVYIHNQGPGGKRYMEVSRKLFDKARKAKGTDEDVVVIYRRK